jgi:hypothetical protein
VAPGYSRKGGGATVKLNSFFNGRFKENPSYHHRLDVGSDCGCFDEERRTSTKPRTLGLAAASLML